MIPSFGAACTTILSVKILGSVNVEQFLKRTKKKIQIGEMYIMNAMNATNS